jgi:hypothetical protein
VDSRWEEPKQLLIRGRHGKVLNFLYSVAEEARRRMGPGVTLLIRGSHWPGDATVLGVDSARGFMRAAPWVCTRGLTRGGLGLEAHGRPRLIRSKRFCSI